MHKLIATALITFLAGAVSGCATTPTKSFTRPAEGPIIREFDGVQNNANSDIPLSDFSDYGTAPGSEAFANFTPDDFALAYALTGGYGRDPAAAKALGMYSPGISWADIITAKAMGMGNVDVSPTQTVDQAMAESTVHFYLNNNIAALVRRLPNKNDTTNQMPIILK